MIYNKINEKVYNPKGVIFLHYNCLIVDDEAALSESTCEYFNMFDVETYWVSNQKDCYDFLSNNTSDLILLDINLGETSGFEICKMLRQTSDILLHSM